MKIGRFAKNRMSLGHSVALLLPVLLAACGGGDAKTGDGDANHHRGPLTAIFSCDSGGAELPASACIVGHQSKAGVGGSLKISDGGEVQNFSESEILDRLAAPRSDITLHQPFTILAQAGGDDNMVLRLQILESGQVVFQDEASRYGVIRIDSDNLSNKPVAGAEPPKTQAQMIKELNEAVDEMKRVNGR